MSELEHCFITGSAQMMRGHAAESAPAWERVLAIDPRHYWALGNLAHALYAQGDHDRADAVQIQRARLHGDNLVSQIVATDLLMNAGDQRGAQAVAERVPALLTSATLEERWIADVWLAFWEACGAFAAHESVQLRALADRAAASIRDADHASPGDASAHGYGTGSYYQAGLVYLSLGMVSRAEVMFALPANDAERYQYLALAAHLRGDDVKARLYLRQMAAGGFARAMPFAGVLFVDVGLVQDAERLVKVWERGRWWPDPFIAPARARILLARGRRIEALETVNKALPVLEKGWGEPWVATVTTASTQVLQALRLKARMLRDNGQLGAAIEVLETAEAHTPLLCSAQRFAGVEWLGLRADLLDLYRQGHRVQAAAALAHELQDALSQADTKDVFGWLALSPELTAALRTGDK
ncbi:MAG TPA: hypothetical protein VFG86_14515 [Chloroflexota bacterium]|nr:hypothetical protein [Chloroflexota bacterium]